MKENNDENNKGKCYDKIKHLVEVDDDFLAVFTMISFHIRNLYIAKNSKMDKKYVDLIVNELGYHKSRDIDNTTVEVADNANTNLLGKLR